jgi:acyl-CoA reductase-like NAD-dependent aldehyde dehydrogenase
VFVAQDADLDVAVRGATALRLYNTGQRIGQSARIHVDAALAYRFADRLHEHLAFLECGDPTKPATDLGPLCSDAALRVAAEQVGLALRQGALVKLGGRPFQPWGLRGYFLQPTLLVEGVGRERVPYEWIAAPLIIVSPTVDVGTAVRESAGMARSPLRLTTFTGQLSKVEDSLRSAGFEVEAQPYTQLVDRARLASSESEQSAATVAIESIREPQADWFPYGSRRGLKL